MGSGGYRYSPPPTHPGPHYPGYTPPPPLLTREWLGLPYPRVNMVVGLKSVDQLCLYAQISGFRGMTEVYNVRTAGNPNDHNDIPQNK